MKLKINDKVRHKIRNFEGKIKSISGITCIITPERPDLKELYPFGISANLEDLDKSDHLQKI